MLNLPIRKREPKSWCFKHLRCLLEIFYKVFDFIYCLLLCWSAIMSFPRHTRKTAVVRCDQRGRNVLKLLPCPMLEAFAIRNNVCYVAKTECSQETIGLFAKYTDRLLTE